MQCRIQNLIQSSKLKYVEWTCYDCKACKGVKSGSSTFSNTCNGKQKKSVFAEKNSDPPHRAKFHVTSSKLKKKKKKELLILMRF